jgi:hypothetical protein
LQAQRLSPLGGNEADAAGNRMEQHEVARLQAALRLAPLEQVLGRQALEHHGGPGLERDRIGQAADELRRHHPPLAIGAGRLAGVGDAVAHLEMRHALAYRLHHTRGLHA